MIEKKIIFKYNNQNPIANRVRPEKDFKENIRNRGWTKILRKKKNTISNLLIPNVIDINRYVFLIQSWNFY